MTPTPKLQIIFNEISEELGRAKSRFPDFHSRLEGWAVLAEEYDELTEAVRHKDWPDMFAEAIQVAAMAIRFLIDCEDMR